MTARVFQRDSKLAPWSRRIALFGAQVAILAAILHRFAGLPTPDATNLLAVGVGLALLGLLIAGISLVQIWRYGINGTGRAISGAIISLLVLAGPLWYLPDLLLRPKIHDITTNPRDPPRFEARVPDRPLDANNLRYLGAVAADQQAQAYPDIRPMTLDKSIEEVYDLVREAVQRMDWVVIAERKPGAGRPGYIQAVAKTLVMGYEDDVAVEVAAGVGETQVNVRSVSRYGRHDFGANARRIRNLFAEVKVGLEEGEKTALELALARRAKAAREARERAKREKKESELRAARAARAAARARARSNAQGAPAQRERRPRRAWGRDQNRFWRQFGE